MAHEADILPTVLNAGDPCAGDEAIFRPGSAANYAEFVGGPLTPKDLTALEWALHNCIQDWLAGNVPFAAIEPHLAALGIDPELRHDSRPILPSTVELPDEVLADVVEDEVPDAAVLVERITGDPFSRPTVGQMAALAWVESLGPNRRAVDAWADDERDRPLVATMNRVDRAPPCLYADGVPQLPLNRRMIPDSGPKVIYVARAYLVGARWCFSSKVDLPALPDLAVLRRRLTVELWRLRTIERRSTWEDVARRRSEVLYRAALEGAQAKTATKQCD